MKDKTKSKYDLYFESLAFHLNRIQSINQFRSPSVNLLDIEIIRPDGYVKFTFSVELAYTTSPLIKEKPIITMWSDWDPFQPFTPTSKKIPITVEDLETDNNVKIKVFYEDGFTYFYIMDLDKDVKQFKMTFSSLNSIIPISESTPYNRYVLHLNMQIFEDHNKPLLIRIIREENMTTKFTKGNYSLAFPSRHLSEKRVTNIYFDKKEQYFLKFGISDGDINKMTSGWMTLLQSGLIFIVVSILMSFGKPSIFEIIASISALAFPLVRNITTYFRTTRLRYYTGKEDINDILTIISIISIGITLFYIFLYFTDLNLILLLIVILSMGLLYLFVSIFGLIALRLGILENYMCDVTNCTSWIPTRYSAWNCYLTGRVMCKKCVSEICNSCPVYNTTRCKVDSSLTILEYEELPCMILCSKRQKDDE